MLNSFKEDSDFSTVKSSIKLSLLYVEFIAGAKIYIKWTAKKLIISKIHPDKIEDWLESINGFVNIFN